MWKFSLYSPICVLWFIIVLVNGASSKSDVVISSVDCTLKATRTYASVLFTQFFSHMVMFSEGFNGLSVKFI